MHPLFTHQSLEQKFFLIDEFSNEYFCEIESHLNKQQLMINVFVYYLHILIQPILIDESVCDLAESAASHDLY